MHARLEGRLAELLLTYGTASGQPATLEASVRHSPPTLLPPLRPTSPPAHPPAPRPQYLSASADRAVRNTYKLLAVLVHSGGVHGGHYFAYVRCGYFWEGREEWGWLSLHS